MSSDPHLLNDPSWRNSSATGAAVNSTIANSTHKTSWFSTLPENGRPSAPTDATTARKPGSSDRSYHSQRTVPPRIFPSLKNSICYSCTQTSSAVEPRPRMTRSDSLWRILKGNSMLKPWVLASILRSPFWADLSWPFRLRNSSVSNLEAS